MYRPFHIIDFYSAYEEHIGNLAQKRMKKAIKALLIVQWLSSVRNVCKYSNHITKGFTVASHKSLL